VRFSVHAFAHVKAAEKAAMAASAAAIEFVEFVTEQDALAEAVASASGVAASKAFFPVFVPSGSWDEYAADGSAMLSEVPEAA
jgi:hypothetical protein